MSGEIARSALPNIQATFPASSLTYADRGRLIAVETPAAVYIGTVKSIIFHMSGKVQVNLQREGYEASATVDPDVIIYAAHWPGDPS